MNNTTIILLFFAFSVLGLMYFDHTHFNGISKSDDNEFFDALLNRSYFTTTTISSVGYGDISPKTRILKLYVAIMQFIIIFGSLSFIFKANQ